MDYLQRESTASANVQEQLLALASPALPNIDLSLDRMQHLLDLLGNPEQRLPLIIHVAGTNGKGSVVAMLRAIYEAAGYQVHSYSSPHLRRFNERIVIAGQEVSDAELLSGLSTLQAALKQQPVTFFEATTALAFLCYAKHPADLLLLETGLGGEYDATNTVPKKLAAVITPIAYDHQDFLGDDIVDIASAKAGIMPRAKKVISALQVPEVHEVLESRAQQLQLPLYVVEQAKMPVSSALPGAHQQQNATLALAVIEALRGEFSVTQRDIEVGLQQVQWPARLQQLRTGPLVNANPNASIFLDGGHNVHAACALRDWLKTQAEPHYLCLGMRRQKDAETFIKTLLELQTIKGIYTVDIENCADGFSAQELAVMVRSLGTVPVTVCETINALAKELACDEKATLLICGSLYLAGNILKTHT